VRAWWQAQSARDQRILSIGGLLAVLLLGYAFLWLPLSRDLETWRLRAAAADTSLAQMQQLAQQLQATAPPPALAPSDGRSLLAVVDAGLREAGLGTALLRVEPVSADQVRVYFQQVSFDRMSDWLHALGRSHGVRVSELSVQRSPGVGMVDARLTLETAR